MKNLETTQTIDSEQLATVAGGATKKANPWAGWHLPKGFSTSPFAQWLTSNYYGSAKPQTQWSPQGGWNNFRGYGGWGPSYYNPYARFAHR